MFCVSTAGEMAGLPAAVENAIRQPSGASTWFRPSDLSKAARSEVRQASIASSFGLRFQGLGYFLTDARTHRGTSGAPVVMRDPTLAGPLPWKLLGVHSARLDMGGRDVVQDESLGLNCAWYADILLALTK